MKIQIDTTSKTILILENAQIKDIIKALAVLFPEEAWMGYTLLSGNSRYPEWNNPYTIPVTTPLVPSNFPWMQGTSVTLLQNNQPSLTGKFGGTQSVYNVDLKM